MMEWSDTRQQNRPTAQGESYLWQQTLSLMKIMQNDYQDARRQLEQVGLHLVEREEQLKQHINYAFLSYHNCRPLCLLQRNTLSPVNRLGSAVLGAVLAPARISPPAQIEARCLGRFEVSSAAGYVAHWPSTKARAVFQYLLLKPREPTPKECLLEALWPEANPQAASNNLKAAIHSLRTNLNSILPDGESQPVVLFSQGNYQLNPELNLAIDVEDFERYRALGRRLEKDNRQAEAMREFEKAECLYRGDYLQDDPYEEWTLLKRESLKDGYLVVTGKLAGYCLQMGDYDGCIHYSLKVLSKDSCREDAYRNLMLSYAKLGQRNRALRWYEICCQSIRNGLDAGPEEETVKLNLQIQNREVGGSKSLWTSPGFN